MKPNKPHRRIDAAVLGTCARDAYQAAVASAENEGWVVHPERKPLAFAPLAAPSMHHAIRRVLDIGLQHPEGHNAYP